MITDFAKTLSKGLIWDADQESDIHFWFYGGVQQNTVGDHDLDIFSHSYLPQSAKKKTDVWIHEKHPKQPSSAKLKIFSTFGVMKVQQCNERWWIR